MAVSALNPAAPMIDMLLAWQKTSLDMMFQAASGTIDRLMSAQTRALRMVEPASLSRSLVVVSQESAATAASEAVIPVGEEILTVGTRVVEGAKTSVRRTVTESPVTKDVTLVHETVVVERRRPSTGEAGDALTEKTVEMFDTQEVPVVGKSFRLIEEVVVRRERSSDVQTIRDTVRRDKVDIEQPSRAIAVKEHKKQH